MLLAEGIFKARCETLRIFPRLRLNNFPTLPVNSISEHCVHTFLEFLKEAFLCVNTKTPCVPVCRISFVFLFFKLEGKNGSRGDFPFSSTSAVVKLAISLPAPGLAGHHAEHAAPSSCLYPTLQPPNGVSVFWGVGDCVGTGEQDGAVETLRAIPHFWL